jgi:hypothetical protein
VLGGALISYTAALSLVALLGTVWIGILELNRSQASSPPAGSELRVTDPNVLKVPMWSGGTRAV